MPPISLTERQRAELEGAAVPTPSIKPCCRAQALLWLADGESIETVADLLHVSRQTVYTWVNRSPEREASTSGRASATPRARDARGPAAVSSTR